MRLAQSDPALPRLQGVRPPMRFESRVRWHLRGAIERLFIFAGRGALPTKPVAAASVHLGDVGREGPLRLSRT